ncbi:MAG: roadblock/LC7 domain-containing protein [Methanofollis liminatans]|jgi:predicted regulator of Ras-like GTPase activity (Roadblock/LC7/MglB family)|uniref:Roadblock/LC7 family protein n=1 Tax=Methanofollis liminatans DSM 4140 TaxID=28892 RepID=J1L577_9EURY|nr:roadblock/LC7 domain-containing protein [Methanofollis liminatans]EJG07915.1 Roadblock/LC7 family protein [Methanofollis liminatans DSM 4140]MDD3111578.1 roadblock/LC7 domain-containing protein [Methanofollis liminatans]
MSEHLGLKERINQFIKEITGVEGVKACVITSRDGILMGRAFTGGVSVPSFAAMSATMLASAEAAASISHIQPPERITVMSPDATIMVISAGERTLLAVVLEDKADLEATYTALTKIAADIAEVL